MAHAPCSIGGYHDEAPVDIAVVDRLFDLERRLAATSRELRRAQAEIALLNDRLAWAEADLAAAGVDAGARTRRPGT